MDTHDEVVTELANISAGVKAIVEAAGSASTEAEMALAIVEAELMGIRRTLAVGVEVLSVGVEVLSRLATAAEEGVEALAPLDRLPYRVED